jgi:hypothetical protein
LLTSNRVSRIRKLSQQQIGRRANGTDAESLCPKQAGLSQVAESKEAVAATSGLAGILHERQQEDRISSGLHREIGRSEVTMMGEHVGKQVGRTHSPVWCRAGGTQSAARVRCMGKRPFSMTGV